MNLIAKPSKDNIKTYVPIGLFLVSLSFLDVFINAFFNFNLMGFLPSQLSYFLPLILGFIGFYLIRIEFSGVRSLDILNKNIRLNVTNAALRTVDFKGGLDKYLKTAKNINLSKRVKKLKSSIISRT